METVHACSGRMSALAEGTECVSSPGASMFVARVAFAVRPGAVRLVTEVSKERRQGRNTSDNYSKIHFDDGPQDQASRVQVVCQCRHFLNADDLNDGDEDAGAEKAQNHNFLAFLDLGFEKDGKREDHNHNVKEDGERCHRCIERNSWNA